MASGLSRSSQTTQWLQVFQEFTNYPMGSGFPGIYEQPNGFRDFQDSRNNPMAGLSFSRNSQTTQWLAPAFPEIHKQPNGWLQLFQKFMNNPMAGSSFPEIHEQPNGWLQLFQKFTNNPMAGFSFSRNSPTTQWLQVFQEFINNPMNCGEDLRSQSLQDL